MTAAVVSEPVDTTVGSATISAIVDAISPGANLRVGVIYMGGNKVRFFTYPIT